MGAWQADTPMGRCLVFGNHLQHKVRDMKNKSADQVGLRKILCFFLIDPDHRYPPPHAPFATMQHNTRHTHDTHTTTCPG